MRKGKNIIASAVSLCLAAAMTITMFPQNLYASSTTKAGVRYVYQDDDPKSKVRTGIEAVNINGVTYYDVQQGRGDLSAENGNQINFYKQILTGEAGDDDKNTSYNGKSNLLDQWAEVAEAVFDDASYYSAEIHASGNFEKNFGKRWGEAGYTDVSKALSAVSDEDINAGTDGEERNDYTVVSGLCYEDSLADVRQNSACQIKNMIKNNAMWNAYNNNKDIFFEKTTKDKDDTMKSLNDDTKQDVLYTMVTCVDDEADTFAYHYNTFVLAFYDFKLVPLAGEGLQYITSAEGYESLQDAKANEADGVEYTTTDSENPTLSYYENKSKVTNNATLSLTESHSETASTTLSSNKSFSFSETIGYSLAIKSTFADWLDFTDTFKVDFTTGQVISTGYSKTTSVNDTKTINVSSNIALPAHSAVTLESTGGKTDVTLDYKCPVAVTYKVAMASMGGEVYADKWKFCIWDTAGYAHKTFSTTFGVTNSDPDDEEKTNVASRGGLTARTNLYNRTVANVDTAGFEESYGNTYGFRDSFGGDDKTCTKIDWGNILNGTISSKEETTPYSVIYKEVDSTGKLTGRTISSVDKTGVYGFEYTQDCPSTFESDYSVADPETGDITKYTANCTLYKGKIYDERGNEVDENTFVSDNTKVIKLTEKEDNKLVFYVTTVIPELAADDSIATTSLNDSSSLLSSANLTLAASGDTDNDTSTSSSSKSADANTPLSAEQVTNVVKWLGVHDPLSSTGGTLSYSTTSESTIVGDIIPLYSLKTVLMNNNFNFGDAVISASGSDQYIGSYVDANMLMNLTIYPGDKFLTRNVTLTGLDADLVNYYDFNVVYGEWKPVKKDADGNWTVDYSESNIASIKKDDVTGNQYVEAGDEEGTYYIQYFINEKKYKSKEDTDYVTNDKVARPVIRFNVRKTPFEGNVKLTGNYTGIVNADTVNLNDELNVLVTDEDGNIVTKDISWETAQAKGITITSDGNVAFQKAGTYQVRVCADGAYSDWLDIQAKDSVASIKVSGNYTTVLGDPAENLNDYLNVTMTDDTGKELSQSYTWDVKELKGISVTENGDITATKAGTYHVRVMNAAGLYSGWRAITVKNATISLNKASATLTKGASATLKATVTPSIAKNKTVTWSSSNSNVTVSKNGTITANKAGTAVITAKNAYGAKATCKVKVTNPVSITKLTKSGKAINVSWNKISGASGYEVYATYCDGQYKLQKTVPASKLSVKLTKMNEKAFTKKAYKMYVKAYKMVNGKKVYLSTSRIAHIQYKKSKKYANATKVTLTGNGNLTRGKSVNLKATAKLKKKRIQLKHDHAIRYQSSDPSIASVDTKGKVTAKSAGTCYVYAIAVDGVSAKIKITVK